MGFLRFLKKYKNLVFIFVVVCVLCSLEDNGREGFREGEEPEGPVDAEVGDAPADAEVGDAPPRPEKEVEDDDEGQEAAARRPFWNNNGEHEPQGAWVGRNLDENDCHKCKRAWVKFLKSEKTKKAEKARLDACKPCRTSKESFTSGYF